MLLNLKLMNTVLIITQYSLIVNTFQQILMNKTGIRRQNININRKEIKNGSSTDQSHYIVHYNHLLTETDGKTPVRRAPAVGTGGDDTHIQHRGNTRGGFFGADDTGDSSDIHAGLP